LHPFSCESSLILLIETRVRRVAGSARSLERGEDRPPQKAEESQGCGKGESGKERGNVCLHLNLFCNVLTPRSSLGDLGNSIKSLKEGADSWSGLMREVQSMVPDIKHLRVKANEAITGQSLAKSS